MMRTIGIFVAGMAAGWVLRSSFGSFRGIAVSTIASSHEIAERMRRFVAEEREFFEDLLAEGKARYQEGRARAEAAVSSKSGPRSVPKAVA